MCSAQQSICHFDKLSCIYVYIAMPTKVMIHLFCFYLHKFLLRSHAVTCPTSNWGRRTSLFRQELLQELITLQSNAFFLRVWNHVLQGIFHETKEIIASFSNKSIYLSHTVKREMFVAIKFGSFENITIWPRFNLARSLKESGWGPYFFQLATTNFGEISNFVNFTK